MKSYYLYELLTQYKEKNANNLYEPVAVGKYGIRKRSEIYKKELSKDYSKNKLIYKDTLTIGLGSNQIDIGILEEDKIYSVSPAYTTFKINTNIVKSSYFNFYFKVFNSFLSKKYLIASARQGKKVDIDNFLLEKICIPDFIKQEKIVNNLQSIYSILEKQKQQLEKLDELIKSKFVEMFGDIFNNTRNFATCPFGKFVNQMNIGPFGSDLKNDCFVDKSKSFCMVYEQKHAIGENINIDVRFINKEKYNKLKRFEVESGDIIVSCRGTIGKCFLLPKNAPKGIIHPSLMMIKPKKTINNNFLLFLLREILSRQNEKGSGVKMAIKATELEKIETINPPKEIQDKYINFVEKIEKIKHRIKKQIDLYTELLNKKMNEYFN